MAKIIDTSAVIPEQLNAMEREWCYNGMDCMVTAEVLDAILPQLDEHTSRTYDFSRDLQGPALEMRLRGVLIDQVRKNEVIDVYFEQIEQLSAQLETIVLEGVGLPSFNWRSPKDVIHLLYDVLGIPAPRGKRSSNRDNLEKLDAYLIARQIVRHMLAMRDIQKKIDVLKTEIDPDGRMRTSYNIAGTNTGRFSSSFSEFGTGGNLQNIEELLRSIFIADQGHKFAKFDGAQIQSRIVGATEWNVLGDGTYLDVCESGDLHTTVAKMVWSELPWTGDLKKDRAIAEQPFYRHYDRRFMCKKLGHGANFDGQAETLAQEAHIPLTLSSEFLLKYHKAFPAHRQLRNWVEDEIWRTGTLIALDGRKRQFWGRRNDPKLVRDGLAYNAQSTEAWIVNNGMLNIWAARDAVMVMHEHDGLVVMYPEEKEDEVVPKIFEQLHFPMELKNGRQLLVPYDCATGWNRGKYDSKKNPDGLKDYVPGDQRKRSPAAGLLDRPLRRMVR